jgi:hypothetical protein
MALAMAGIPLITTVSCDPYGGLSFYRDDDYDDCYFWDDCYYNDCYFWDDCYYDDYYYDEIVIWD